jgi:CO/xanthine dehydrogenase Mo-binding subunit
MSSIGKSSIRSDALGKVTGAALYPGDLIRPDQLYMKILFAGRPHARIVRLDTSEAERSVGVAGVYTASDVPANEYGLIMPDQPVLCGPGSSKPYADRVRFIGDQVAVVVAESEKQAEAALAKIKVEYEDLPVLLDPAEAMRDREHLIHPDRESNVFCHYKIRKGDVQSGFEAADVVIEGEYHTPAQEHAYLQPEAGLAYIDEAGRVTVEVAGQWTHEDQKQIAHALGLPQDQVRVIYPVIGGAFGGREDLSVQIVLALAAWKLHQQGIDRPVKIIWSRKESILGHHKRHPFTLKMRWGATQAGKVIAAECEIIQDGGAYAYTSTKVLGNATLMCTGPYEIPNVHVDAYSVYTNHIPGGAFRGFGGPQAAFAAEGQMNKLAEALDIDAVELRERNLLKEGSLLSVNSPIPEGVSIAPVLAAAADAGGWRRTEAGWQRPEQVKQDASPPLRRGTGVACGLKNIGFSFGFPEQCWATVELRGGAEIDEVILRHAGAEVGQGTHSAMVQMAAEALDVPAERVTLIASDTAYTDNSGSASASRMTFMAGNAIKGAAEAALAKWKEEERPAIASYQYRPPPTTPYDPVTGESMPNFSYGYVAQVVTAEVDTDTGSIRLLDVITSNDVGRAINPQQVEGQIEGAVVQAMGYVVTENFQHQGGYVQTDRLSTYLIPTVLDIPERMQSLILEPGGRAGWAKCRIYRLPRQLPPPCMMRSGCGLILSP